MATFALIFKFLVSKTNAFVVFRGEGGFRFTRFSLKFSIIAIFSFFIFSYIFLAFSSSFFLKGFKRESKEHVVLLVNPKTHGELNRVNLLDFKINERWRSGRRSG